MRFLIKEDLNKKMQKKIDDLIEENFKSTNTFDAGINDGDGSPSHILKLILKFCKENKYIVRSKILNYFILFIQCKKYYDLCDVTCSGRHSETLYKKRYIDIITLCNTYDIFLEYSKYIVSELNNHLLSRSDIFDTINYEEKINNELIEMIKKDI